jgi:predicted phosphohydrolase
VSIYVIGDLHLSFNEDKPMYIFGDNWRGHEEKIKKDWVEKVTDNDLVILPGDFSWSMKLEDTEKDFEYINNLPGTKLLLKGNHDYWWNTVTKMKNFLEEKNFKNIDFIYNQGYEFENYIIAGTRGWSMLEEDKDEKVLNRELARLEASIKDGLQKSSEPKEVIVFMHYPPISNAKIINKEEAQFVEIMKKYNVKKCFYGHLHGSSIKDAFEGMFDGIEFKLVSADGLDFKLYKI